jgi:hypothetical protein
VIIDRPFKEGEILALELHSVPKDWRRQLFGRVLHAKLQPGVGWILGCKFVKRLTTQQLDAIL